MREDRLGFSRHSLKAENVCKCNFEHGGIFNINPSRYTDIFVLQTQLQVQMTRKFSYMYRHSIFRQLDKCLVRGGLT